MDCKFPSNINLPQQSQLQIKKDLIIKDESQLLINIDFEK